MNAPVKPKWCFRKTCDTCPPDVLRVPSTRERAVYRPLRVVKP